MTDFDSITQLLGEAKAGDQGALDRLLPLVYDELKCIARRQGAGRLAPSLNTTAVVHEAYLKVFGRDVVSLQDRAHFFGVVCLAIRQVLRDHARRIRSMKHGGQIQLLTLTEHDAPIEAEVDEFIALDQALDLLAAANERLAEVVQLRYFAGLSVEEVAEVLKITPRTVMRDWKKARLFLAAALESPDG